MKKGYINIILVVLLAILVGVAGYLSLIKKPIVLTTTDQARSTDTTTTQEVKPPTVDSSKQKANPPTIDNSKQKAKFSFDILKDGEYLYGGQRIKLVDGKHLLKPLAGESQTDYFVKLDTEHIAFGDLNNDGQEDAAVVLVSRAGGTGTFRDLVAVLNQNGSPLDVAHQYLGDRVGVNSLLIQASVISVNMTPWDKGAGTPKTVRYKLQGDKLLEI